MPKALKIVLIVLAALVALAIAAVAIIAATFNPNDYKPLIIKTVQEKKQRTLSIPGEIRLTFFPRLGADLGQISISEHRRPEEFASVRRASVSLALLPLFSKQLVVDRIVIDGLHVNIVRHKDGTTNVDDLMSKDESSGEQLKFDIDGVRITGSSVAFDDRQAGRKLAIGNLDLTTGKIANGVASKFDLSADVRNSAPALDAKVTAKSGFTIDLDRKHYVLDGIDAEIRGKLLDFADSRLTLKGDAGLKPDAKQIALDGITLAFAGKRDGQEIDFRLDAPKLNVTDQAVTGGKVGGELTLKSGSRTVTATYALPSFEGSPKSFRLPALTLDAAVRDKDLEANAKLSGAFAGNLDKMLFSSPKLTLALDGKQGGNAISGALATPLEADLQGKAIRLPGIAADMVLPNPGGGTLKLKANGRADVDLDKMAATTALKGSLDESSFDAKFNVGKFSPLALHFDVGIDRINLDRYRVNKPAAVAPAKADPKAAADKPIDLAFLKDLNVTGNVRIDGVTVQNMKAANLRAGIRIAGGRAAVEPLTASLYGGSVSGALSATAANPPQFAVRQSLTGIQVGALLRDAIGKEPVDGRGNVQLDVTTRGATVPAMKKALDGTARLDLRDGAVRGINIAQVIREGRARLGALRGDTGTQSQSGTGSAEQKTDFSELSGSFRIANGVARNDDLTVKSPLLRIAGSGDVNLGEDRLDYLVRATVVSTLQGQGGPELQALKGVTVPVRLSGPFAAIGWKVDFGAMAQEAAKQKIEEKKEDVKKKLQEQLGNKLKGLFGK